MISITQKGQNKNVGFPTFLYCLFPTLLFYPLHIATQFSQYLHQIWHKNFARFGQNSVMFIGGDEARLQHLLRQLLSPVIVDLII